MANPFLGVRIPRELDQAIAERMQVTGQSKSDVVIKALKAYLGLLPCQERLAAIEQRLAALETLLSTPASHHSSDAAPVSHHLDHPFGQG